MAGVDVMSVAGVDTMSAEDKEFLAKCEEELKYRYTEQDEEFMKVFNAEPSIPPIIQSWWVPQNSGRRNDRRNNRRSHPYGNKDHDRRDHHERRGYNDYGSHGQGYRSQRPRYY